MAFLLILAGSLVLYLVFMGTFVRISMWVTERQTAPNLGVLANRGWRTLRGMKWRRRKAGDVTPLRIGVAIVLFAVAAILAVYVFPHDPSFPSKPGAWSVWLDNRWFLEAVRTAAIFVALYILVSVLALTASGRWLAKLGPASVDAAQESEATSLMKAGIADLELQLLKSQAATQQAQNELLSARSDIDQYKLAVRSFRRPT